MKNKINALHVGIILAVVITVATVPIALGDVVTSDADVTIQSSNAPTIINSSNITSLDVVPCGNSTMDNAAGAPSSGYIWFIVEDNDGVENLNLGNYSMGIMNSTGGIEGVIDTADPHSVNCNEEEISWNRMNVSCNGNQLNMSYYYPPTVYNLTLWIWDDDSNKAEGYDPFDFNPATHMQLGTGAALSHGTADVGEADVAANQSLRVDNCGNENITDINVTAIDLQGTTYSSYSIPANSFEAVGSATPNSGTTLSNNTATKIGSLYIDPGSGANQELYFYLDVPSTEIQAQTYNTIGLGNWTVAVNS